jgi:hypothetical protein
MTEPNNSSPETSTKNVTDSCSYKTPPHIAYNPSNPVAFYDDHYQKFQAMKAASLKQLGDAQAVSNAADFFEWCVDR